jgi:hypothetical protein
MTSWRNVACCILLSATTAGTVVAQFVEPKWPQQFTLERGERMSYGFVVGVPGAIVVNVTVAGQIAVALLKPDGSLAKNAQGAGAVRIEYTATKEDIAAGEAWRVALAEPSAGRGREAPSATPAPPAVSGSIAITHPAGDVRKVKLIVKQRPAPPARAPEQLDASLEAYRAAREAAQTAARAQRARTLQMKVTAAAAAVTQAGSPRPAPPGMTSRGAAAVAAQAGAATSTSKSAVDGTGSTSGGGAAPVGTNQPASVAPATAPVIASLDTAAGTPGDQFLVTGSGFGPPAGLEAHFIVGPQKDYLGTITYYSDGQIMVQVPNKEGLPQYGGKFYLRRGTNSSLLVPFRFDPKMDYVTLPVTSDRQFGGSGESFEIVENTVIAHYNSGFWCKDDDEFWKQLTLANGWVVDSAYVRQQKFGTRGAWISGDPGSKGDAYISVVTLGSSSPRTKVHWWCDEPWFSHISTGVHYWPVVVIRGPKGVPWQ